jgi:cysteine desulfurase
VVRAFLERHYLDHASTSPLRPEAASAICAWAENGPFADPSRPFAEAEAVRVAIESAREEVACFLGVRAREVVFTSSGTEAVNWATKGARSASSEAAPIVLSPVEHSSVRRSAEALGPVEHLRVDQTGRIDLDHLEALLDPPPGRPRPALVHCQHANHEVGTLQPVAEVAERCARAGVLLHVDACASAGHLPLDEVLGASLVSVSAHKLGAAPGVGALVLRRGVRLAPLLLGADQERARRAGFENVPGILAFAAVARALSAEGALAEEADRARRQRDALLAAATAVAGVSVYGDPDGLPHLACLGLEGLAGEGVVLGLDRLGIAVHSGSACSAEAFEPSPVLQAIGVDPASSVRLSVGWSTTDADVAAFAEAFPSVVARLRSLTART